MNPGQQITNYRLLQKIGEGGFGDVFRATDVRTGQEVALKCSHKIPSDKKLDTEQRFMREISCTSRLNHPRIVRMLDYGIVADGTLFIVMEFVRGETLERRIKDNGVLDYDTASDVILQVLDALSEAHRNGIVHRDLKPSNIMLSRQPNGSTLVKLLDFGIAKAFDGSEPDLTRIQFEKGAGFGTPQYMPPEQFFGNQIGPHSDIYSAGVVLLEMLTGAQPFAGSSLSEVIEKQINVFPTIPSPFDQGPIADVFTRSLAKQIAMRYSSAFEMYSDIDAITRHQSPFLHLYRSATASQTRVENPIPTDEELAAAAAAREKGQNANLSSVGTIVYDKKQSEEGGQELKTSAMEALETVDSPRVTLQPMSAVAEETVIDRFSVISRTVESDAIPEDSRKSAKTIMLQEEEATEISPALEYTPDSLQMGVKTQDYQAVSVSNGEDEDSEAFHSSKTAFFTGEDVDSETDDLPETFYVGSTQDYKLAELETMSRQSISGIASASRLEKFLATTEAGRSLMETEWWKKLLKRKENVSILLDKLYEKHFVEMVIVVSLTIGVLTAFIVLLLID